MSRALLCTVIGEKYERIYRGFQRQFEAYAERCQAEPVVIREPIDRTGRHSVYTQKLLIPMAFSRYQEVAHLDVDMLLSATAGDIFSEMPETAAFGAVVTPRGTRAYEIAWNDAPFTRLSDAEYFAGKDLRSKNPVRQVNGGVLLFRPDRTADLFASWYFDEQRYAGKSDHYYSSEEDPLAYLSQDNGIFFELPARFNRQLIYSLCESEEGLRARRELKFFPNRVHRRLRRALGVQGGSSLGMKWYKARVEALLREGNLIHFSASYPIIRVDPALVAG
jgi:hypothetical protein